ncbi:MAG: AmpG family muropeptide MFS transporter [Holophagaceae bacterium]|nr:AmpG family muropeptide MFS transporter [Holophagaceae bacterium]
MVLSVVFYKNLGVPNTAIALYTSWLYLPWVIKPLWSPVVDLLGTKRSWVYLLQGVVGAAFALLALTVPGSSFFRYTLAMFWLIAFASATHDIAADGFYLLALSEQRQSAFVGLRSAFYRAAMIAGQGGLVLMAGKLAERTGDPRRAWMAVFGLLAALFLSLFAWHRFVLPRPVVDRPAEEGRGLFTGFVETFRTFFARRDLALTLGFLLTFRLGEAQAIKMVTPFLLDPAAKGGLGLSTAQVGLAYGTVGMLALTAGGLAGGFMISRMGLKRWLWPMTLAVHVPNLAFVLLAIFRPTGLATIASAIAIEQFGYGFGFTAYIMFMVMIADGAHKTAHYAIATGFMALGMMLPGMASGWIQEQLGYLNFFIWVCCATVPSIILTAFLRIDPAFGRRGPT